MSVSPPSGPSRRQQTRAPHKSLTEKTSDHITAARALRWNNKPPCLPLEHESKNISLPCMHCARFPQILATVLLSVNFHGPVRLPYVWILILCRLKKGHYACLVVMFNWIHLELKSWDHSFHSSLRSEQLMIFCPLERQASLFHPRECFIGT